MSSRQKATKKTIISSSFFLVCLFMLSLVVSYINIRALNEVEKEGQEANGRTFNNRNTRRRRRRRRNEISASSSTASSVSASAPSLSVVKNHQQQHQAQQQHAPVPIVIISSLRSNYLSQVMESLAYPQNQNPNTPSWIATSSRYLFIHKHQYNDRGTRLQECLKLAERYDYKVYIFDQLYKSPYHELLHPFNKTMSYHAKYTFYEMMTYLFDTLNVTEDALIIEDDVVVAYDALMVVAALLLEKQKIKQQQLKQLLQYSIKKKNTTTATIHIHNLSLGGWGGENRINAHPDTYLAVRPPYFQAMAYTLDRPLFHHIRNEFQHYEEQLANEKLQQGEGEYQDNDEQQQQQQENPDWCEEITRLNFISQLTSLTPSASRMQHIGVEGMGADGHESGRPILPQGWATWNDTIRNPDRTLLNFRRDPLPSPSDDDDNDQVITDVFGFLCPQRLQKGLQCSSNVKNYFKLFPPEQRFGPTNISRYGLLSSHNHRRTSSSSSQSVVTTTAADSIDIVGSVHNTNRNTPHTSNNTNGGGSSSMSIYHHHEGTHHHQDAQHEFPLLSLDREEERRGGGSSSMMQPHHRPHARHKFPLLSLNHKIGEKQGDGSHRKYTHF